MTQIEQLSYWHILTKKQPTHNMCDKSINVEINCSRAQLIFYLQLKYVVLVMTQNVSGAVCLKPPHTHDCCTTDQTSQTASGNLETMCKHME